MNLLEAVKSGKKFRRVGGEVWGSPLGDHKIYPFTSEELLAEYETLNEVTITRDDFDKAYDKAGESTFIHRERLAKELGLTPDSVDLPDKYTLDELKFLDKQAAAQPGDCKNHGVCINCIIGSNRKRRFGRFYHHDETCVQTARKMLRGEI